jgi:hypothetical protein
MNPIYIRRFRRLTQILFDIITNFLIRENLCNLWMIYSYYSNVRAYAVIEKACGSSELGVQFKRQIAIILTPGEQNATKKQRKALFCAT